MGHESTEIYMMLLEIETPHDSCYSAYNSRNPAHQKTFQKNHPGQESRFQSYGSHNAKFPHALQKCHVHGVRRDENYGEIKDNREDVICYYLLCYKINIFYYWAFLCIIFILVNSADGFFIETAILAMFLNIE